MGIRGWRPLGMVRGQLAPKTSLAPRSLDSSPVQMSEGSSSSPAAPPPPPLPDSDDILRQIFVRLPPLPSSLLRASLVCERWRRLLSDPQFHRQFSAHHRVPPLLGFFVGGWHNSHFTPTLEPPNRIPSRRFSFALLRDHDWSFECCRHGLVLLLSLKREEIAVWNPMTGDQRRWALPLGFSHSPNHSLQAALVCNDQSKQAFRVVCLRSDSDLTQAEPQVFASVYDSETGVWGDLISTSIRSLLAFKPSILVRNSIFWLLGFTNNFGILQFDMDKQSLAVMEFPKDADITGYSGFQILRMEDGGLGLAISSEENDSIQLWERKADSAGAAKWMLQKEILLPQLLSMRSLSPTLLGYDEDGHVIFVWTIHGVFMIQLKSMQFKNLFETDSLDTYHPYRSFYTSGRGIGSGNIGAETLNNT